MKRETERICVSELQRLCAYQKPMSRKRHCHWILTEPGRNMMPPPLLSARHCRANVHPNENV